MKFKELLFAGVIAFALAGCGGGSTSGNAGYSSDRFLASATSVTNGTQPAVEQAISGSGLGNIFNPAIASDGQGNSIAVWVQYEGTARNLYANRYTPESGWGTAEPIYAGTNTVDGGTTVFDSSPSHPGIAFDRNGNAMAYWTQTDWVPYQSVQHAYVRRFTPQAGWETPQQLDTGGIGGSISQIAFDRHGNAMAMLERTVSGPTEYMRVYTRRYTPAGGWESEGPELGTVTGDTRIAFAPDDTAIAIWYADGGDLFGSWVSASRYVPGSGWSHVVQLGPSRGDFPQIAFDDDSNATAVWRVRDGSQTDKIYAARFTSAGVLEAPQIIAEAPVPIGDSNPIGKPGLAVSANGDAIAAWGSGQKIFASRYTPGTGWGAAASIDAGYSSEAPRVVMDSGGTAVVVWNSSLSVAYGIRSSPSGDWGPVQSFGPADGTFMDVPEIALDRTGNIMAVWRQLSSAMYIYARRFNIYQAQ